MDHSTHVSNEPCSSTTTPVAMMTVNADLLIEKTWTTYEKVPEVEPPPDSEGGNRRQFQRVEHRARVSMLEQIFTAGGYGVGANALPLLETGLLRDLLAAIMNKRSWSVKFRDAAIRAKWHAEFLAVLPPDLGAPVPPDSGATDAAMPSATDAVLAEVFGGYREESYRVLKQVHPDMDIDTAGAEVLDQLVADVEERLVRAAHEAADAEAEAAEGNADDLELTEVHVQRAVAKVLLGELVKHGDSEGRKALTKFYQSSGGESGGDSADDGDEDMDIVARPPPPPLAALPAAVLPPQEAALVQKEAVAIPSERVVTPMAVSPEHYRQLVDFVFDELDKHYLLQAAEVPVPAAPMDPAASASSAAAAASETILVEPAAVDGVFQSDNGVPEHLQRALADGADKLANVPDEEKDWHPGSNKQVLDLVHPSLYCLVRGVTRVVGDEHVKEQPVPWRQFVNTGDVLPLETPAGSSDTSAKRVLERVKRRIESQRAGDSQAVADEIALLKAADPKKYSCFMGEYCRKSHADVEHFKKWRHPREHPMATHFDEGSAPAPAISEQDWKSPLFQWLPSEFLVGEDGAVRVASYINNLSPRRAPGLYTVIARIFERFVPLFERVLADERHCALKPRPSRLPMPKSGWEIQQERAKEKREHPEEFENEDSSPDSQEFMFHEEPPMEMPENLPDTFAGADPSFLDWVAESAPISLRGRHLQVICKLADIVLTPESPTYAGGSWHVEGMQNESIAATGIFYFASENITALSSDEDAAGQSPTPTRLAFRTNVSEPMYEQGDSRGVQDVFGLTDGSSLIQPRGSVETVEGRCLAFPNTLQHRVSPFRLLDATKPGRRRILVFFLVDPATRVISTAAVPPQQRDWVEQELCDPENILPHAFGRDARDVAPEIISFLPGLMSLEEANAFRDELMMERKFFVSHHNDKLFERQFSLCEH